jgi:hypothetical protein
MKEKEVLKNQNRPSEIKQPTRAEIEAARHTRAQLAEWGIAWPPKKGWRKQLLRQADRRAETPEQRRYRSEQDKRDRARVAEWERVHVGPYEPGERHRNWPAWTWDGEMFIKTTAWEQNQNQQEEN